VHQSEKRRALQDALDGAVAAAEQQAKKKNQCAGGAVVNITVAAVDVTSAASVRAWLDRAAGGGATTSNIDVCVHAAAISSPARCEADPSVATATNVPKALFETLRRHSPRMRVVALSTDQVYDGNLNNAGESYYTEDSPTNPCNVYGRTKVQLEEYLMATFSENCVLLRSSILLGPAAPFVEAHDTFLHFCAGRERPTAFYTNEVRSVLAVRDAVRIIWQCCGLLRDDREAIPPVGVYCMGGPAAVSRYDMAVSTLTHLNPSDHKASLAVPTLKQQPQAPPSSTTDAAGKAATAVVVQSPLNIAMDSSKLMAATGLCGGRVSNTNHVAMMG